mmetsp:Transcript_65778/g.152840  ORF Transcript_65778/g.152840 Transcript_65778/m.152840 type:complete len:125 (+) Transcript_65778:98-472(+)
MPRRAWPMLKALCGQRPKASTRQDRHKTQAREQPAHPCTENRVSQAKLSYTDLVLDCAPLLSTLGLGARKAGFEGMPAALPQTSRQQCVAARVATRRGASQDVAIPWQHDALSAFWLQPQPTLT